MKWNKKYLALFLVSLSVSNVAFTQTEQASEMKYIDDLLYPDDLSQQEKGLNEVIQLAENGSLYAQKALAQYFEFSSPANYEKAAYWHEKAVDMHNDMMSASFILEYYRKGLIKDFDQQKLFEWHKFFVDQHNIDKLSYFVGQAYFYGDIVKQNYSEALIYLEKSLNYGDIYAARIIAQMYKNGLGVKKDLEKEKFYYQKGIELGDVIGVYHLAELNLKGAKTKGKKVNKEELFEYELSESQSDFKEKLTLNIGLSYLYGWGVDIDLNQAKIYLTMSAEAGNTNARAILNNIE